MIDKEYIARLTSMTADIRKLNVKMVDAEKIKLNGEDILDKIKENKTILKHAQDTRETITENDLWGQWVETLEDGTVIIHDDWITTLGDYSWNSSITKVEDNKIYAGNELYGNIQTERIIDGVQLFSYCSNFSLFDSDLSNLENGNDMFYQTLLASFNSDLPSLTNGSYMFGECYELTSFNSDLPSLMNGSDMFYNTKLKSFTSDLPSLTDGTGMFSNCSNLTSFNSDLSSLTNGNGMFWDCTNLSTFTSDLSSLTNGRYMFYKNNLTTFTSDLSSLTDGTYMFNQCKLDAQSVMYIIHSIKNITAEKQLYIDGTIPYVTSSNGVYSAPRGFMSNGRYVFTYNNPKITTYIISASDVGKLTIGIDVTNNSSTIAQQLQTFAEGTLFDSWADLKQAFVDKGWTVTWQYGGGSTSITYDLRGERLIPCPIYAQLIEILPQEGEEELTDEQKERAEYCSEDGTRYYNIEWGHDVTHPEEFQQFDSLETACVSYGVMPKEYLETNGQTTLF